METLSKIFIAIVAIEHFFILYIEMFAWESMGKKVFKGVLPDDLFSKTKAMALNQGLYNGFLAAGLSLSFMVNDAILQSNIAIFFLCCVIMAGIVGSLTLLRKIFFTQALPAIIALILVIVASL